MGTSTKKVLPRSSKIIGSGVTNGQVGSGGSGLSNLIPKLVFPEKGLGKIKKTTGEVFNSGSYYSSIKSIIRVISKIKKDGIVGIGIPGFSGYNYYQKIDVLCDYLGIEDNEYLKQSFKDTLEEIDILSPETDELLFIRKYIQNIMKNVIESYSFEDASENIIDFDDKKTDEEYGDYIESKIGEVLQINLNDELISSVNDDKKFAGILNKTYVLAMNALKG
jgi:hypothetical protein